jgi:hypothetical protein
MKKKKRRRLKPNVIIYTCLFSALLLLLAGAYDIYTETKDSSIKTTIKKAVNEVNNEKEEVLGAREEEQEPSKLKDIDKSASIMKYLNNIKDRIVEDNLITLDQINTWNSYSIDFVQYNRKIADNYYEYIVDIKINNKDAKLPVAKRTDLSKDDYVVISLLIDMVYENNTLSVKNLDGQTY